MEQPTDPELALLTREEVARELRVPLSIVRALQESGALRCRKIGTRVWTTRRAIRDYVEDAQLDDYRKGRAS